MKAPVIRHRFHDPNPIARMNRQALREAGVLTVTLLGGPGCGKTTLIAATVGGAIAAVKPSTSSTRTPVCIGNRTRLRKATATSTSAASR